MLTVPIQALTVVQAFSADLGAEIIIEIFTLGEHILEEGRWHIWSQPRVRIIPQTSKSVLWFYPLASKLENFFSLLLGYSVITQSVELFRKEKSGSLVRRRRGKAIDGEIHHSIPCSSEQLSSALLLWFALPEKFQPVENLINATIQNTDEIVESQFLTLAQALEAFHRVLNEKTIITKSEFAAVSEKVQDAIKKVCDASPIRQRLLDNVPYANEPTFKMRLQNLVMILDMQQASMLLGDVKKFIRRVVDTRNKLTHPGIPLGKNALSSPTDFFHANRQMLALLRLVVLDHLGLPPAHTFIPIYDQATQFQ